MVLSNQQIIGSTSNLASYTTCSCKGQICTVIIFNTVGPMDLDLDLDLEQTTFAVDRIADLVLKQGMAIA